METSAFEYGFHVFYMSTNELALFDATNQIKYMRKARKLHQKIKKEVKRGNINCHHIMSIIDAELVVYEVNVL